MSGDDRVDALCESDDSAMARFPIGTKVRDKYLGTFRGTVTGHGGDGFVHVTEPAPFGRTEVIARIAASLEACTDGEGDR